MTNFMAIPALCHFEPASAGTVLFPTPMARLVVFLPLLIILLGLSRDFSRTQKIQGGALTSWAELMNGFHFHCG